MSDPPERNRHGREIWFRYADDGEGGYAPVNRKGCVAFILAGCWVLISAAIGMSLIVRWHNTTALFAMFAIGAPGLILMAITVRRHS